MNTQIITSINGNGSALPAGFRKRNDGSIMDCHNQWKRRPDDERVTDLADLLSRTQTARAASREVEGIEWGDLDVIATSRGDLALNAGTTTAVLNNYAFGQLCSLPTEADGTIADASFVRKLSPETAAIVVNERLRARGVNRKNKASLLLRIGTAKGPTEVRCLATEAYERVWNHDLALCTQSLCERGTWGPAQAFRTASGSKANAWGPGIVHPLGWVGDRNMFVCLVDYEGAVQHNGNTYARFFLLSNSEVGAGKLKIVFGLMDFACSNFILWGCTEVYEASFRHTASIHERWGQLSKGLTRQLAAESRDTIVSGINAARGYLLGDDSEATIARVVSHTGLPKGIVGEAYNVALGTPRYGDARSVWGMVNGLTEVSQTSTTHADKRISIDGKAASLMQLASNR